MQAKFNGSFHKEIDLLIRLSLFISSLGSIRQVAHRTVHGSQLFFAAGRNNQRQNF